MANSANAVSAAEFEQIRQWLVQNRDQIPEPIGLILDNLLSSYDKLVKNKKNQKEILFHLRQAMGLIPKSEKGSSEKKCPGIRGEAAGRL